MSLNARAHPAGAARRTIDPNVSFLVSNQWEGDDGRFGALFNVSYAKTRYRDQNVIAGAMVPFATATNPPLGAGAALDACPIRRRITPTGLRSSASSIPTAAHSGTAALAGGPRPRLAHGAGLHARLIGPESSIPICWRATHCSPATSRATANVLPPASRCSSRRMTLRNTPSRPSTRAIARRCSTTCTSPSPTGGEPSARTRHPPSRCIPDTNIIKTRAVGLPFGFNSGDSTDQSHRHLRLCAERQMGNRRQPETRGRPVIPGQSVRHQLHRDAHRRAFRRRSRSTSTHSDGIPSWHFNNDAKTARIRHCGPRPSSSEQGPGTRATPQTVPGRRRLRLRRRQRVQASEVRRAL